MKGLGDREALLEVERVYLALRRPVREDGRWIDRCALCGAVPEEHHRGGAFCAELEVVLARSATLSDVARAVQEAGRDSE